MDPVVVEVPDRLFERKETMGYTNENNERLLRIVPMTAELVPAVAALEAVSFSTPWSESAIRSELDNAWAIWLTAIEGNQLVGYLGVQYGPDGGDIMTIATDPAWQGQGIAKALIAAMTDIFRQKGLSWLTLEVRPSNSPAMALYESLGFRQVGRRKNYYRNPTEDALLLTLWLKEDESC